MDDLLRAQVRKASQMVAATESWKQETTRGQELKRKDCLRPPRNRPDFYPSSQPSYAESSTSHGPQGSQPQGSSWYGPSNPTYSSNSSSSPVQQQQQQLGYGQYPPAQQTGHPYQETSTGYYPQQNPTTGQQPAYSPSNAAPNPYSYPGQRPATHGYPPSSTLQHSSPPPHFSSSTSPQYGQPAYHQTSQYSPPPRQGSPPPSNQGSHPSQYPYQPPSNSRTYSQDSYGSSTSTTARCRHGQLMTLWY